MDLGLKGKVAVVTGGSRGIGRATAIAFAEQGADVAICARGEESLESTLAELRTHGTRVFGQVADVTASGGAERFIQETAAALGAIDVLVNNVGGSLGTGVVGSTDAEWLGTFDLNLFQSVRASRAAIPHMKQRGGGSIVIISSISGHSHSPGSQYGAAKAAEIFLGNALALELGASAIRVNTLCPGSIQFPGGGWAGYRDRDPEGYRRFETEEFPLGRLGTAEEVARVVVFVSSPAASWINGALIPVDGGQLRPGVFSLVPR